MAAEGQAAGGVLVEPVRQRRVARQAEAQRVEVILQALAAFRSAMNGEARWLVDHQHQSVAVEQAGEHLVPVSWSLSKNCRNGYHGRNMNDSTPKTWWKRLSGGLARTSSSLGGAIAGLVTKRKLDADTVEELEHELIRADLGPEFAGRMAAALGEGRFDKAIAPDEVKTMLAGEIEKVLGPVAKPLEVTAKPFIVLVAGVNGSGKTTTIGKLAANSAPKARQ